MSDGMIRKWVRMFNEGCCRLNETCSHNTEYSNKDLYIAINVVTLANRRRLLPDEGLYKPKHVAATIIVLNDVNCLTIL